MLQETFIAVWQSAKTYQPRGAPAAWLWVIARNQAAMLLRKRGQPPVQLPGDETEETQGPSADPAASPWTWPVRPPADRGAWLCACAVFAVGLAAFTIRGARTRLADDS